jgi:hypothetical protein
MRKNSADYTPSGQEKEKPGAEPEMNSGARL